jgi:hypothetical protein
MAIYTINYTNAENLAMSYVAADVNDWIQNAAHERARIAIEEIVKICVEKCLETNTQIPGSKDAMVELAFEQGWVIAAVDKVIETI